jgi:hypothetical protein
VVKQRELAKLSGPFEAEALRILQAVPGLSVTSEPARADRRTDAVLSFAGAEAWMTVEVRSRANAATAWQLVHEARAHRDTPLLLIAGESTTDARQILQWHGISLIDGLGNVHVELPGLLMHWEGRRPRPTARPMRLDGKAGVAAQALLLHPERAWRVQQLAEEARLSIGLAHRVLTRLEAEGLVIAEGSGRNRVRRVADPTALLDLWAEEDAYRPVETRGYLLAQTPRQLIQELGRSLDRNRVEYALTGAAAGSIVAPFITAVPVVEVWVNASATSRQLCEAAGAEAVTSGHNVLFLQARNDTPLAFREQAEGLWVANRFRLYADLRRAPRRGREQADHLRQEVIGF